MYNAVIPSGIRPYAAMEGYCVTKIYSFPAQTYIQTIVTTGSAARSIGYMRLFRDGGYLDYWGLNQMDNYERNCINVTANGLAMTMAMNRLSDSYAYLKETGQILFAGKNSIYYGHENISELN